MFSRCSSDAGVHLRRAKSASSVSKPRRSTASIFSIDHRDARHDAAIAAARAYWVANEYQKTLLTSYLTAISQEQVKKSQQGCHLARSRSHAEMSSHGDVFEMAQSRTLLNEQPKFVESLSKKISASPSMTLTAAVRRRLAFQRVKSKTPPSSQSRLKENVPRPLSVIDAVTSGGKFGEIVSTPSKDSFDSGQFIDLRANVQDPTSPITNDMLRRERNRLEEAVHFQEQIKKVQKMENSIWLPLAQKTLIDPKKLKIPPRRAIEPQTSSVETATASGRNLKQKISSSSLTDLLRSKLGRSSSSCAKLPPQHTNATRRHYGQVFSEAEEYPSLFALRQDYEEAMHKKAVFLKAATPLPPPLHLHPAFLPSEGDLPSNDEGGSGASSGSAANPSDTDGPENFSAQRTDSSGRPIPSQRSSSHSSSGSSRSRRRQYGGVSRRSSRSWRSSSGKNTRKSSVVLLEKIQELAEEAISDRPNSWFGIPQVIPPTARLEQDTGKLHNQLPTQDKDGTATHSFSDNHNGNNLKWNLPRPLEDYIANAYRKVMSTKAGQPNSNANTANSGIFQDLSHSRDYEVAKPSHLSYGEEDSDNRDQKSYSEVLDATQVVEEAQIIDTGSTNTVNSEAPNPYEGATDNLVNVNSVNSSPEFKIVRSYAEQDNFENDAGIDQDKSSLRKVSVSPQETRNFKAYHSSTCHHICSSIGLSADYEEDVSAYNPHDIGGTNWPRGAGLEPHPNFHGESNVHSSDQDNKSDRSTQWSVSSKDTEFRYTPFLSNFDKVPETSEQDIIDQKHIDQEDVNEVSAHRDEVKQEIVGEESLNEDGMHKGLRVQDDTSQDDSGSNYSVDDGGWRAKPRYQNRLPKSPGTHLPTLLALRGLVPRKVPIQGSPEYESFRWNALKTIRDWNAPRDQVVDFGHQKPDEAKSFGILLESTIDSDQLAIVEPSRNFHSDESEVMINQSHRSGYKKHKRHQDQQPTHPAVQEREEFSKKEQAHLTPPISGEQRYGESSDNSRFHAQRSFDQCQAQDFSPKVAFTESWGIQDQHHSHELLQKYSANPEQQQQPLLEYFHQRNGVSESQVQDPNLLFGDREVDGLGYSSHGTQKPSLQREQCQPYSNDFNENGAKIASNTSNSGRAPPEQYYQPLDYVFTRSQSTPYHFSESELPFDAPDTFPVDGFGPAVPTLPNSASVNDDLVPQPLRYPVRPVQGSYRQEGVNPLWTDAGLDNDRIRFLFSQPHIAANPPPYWSRPIHSPIHHHHLSPYGGWPQPSVPSPWMVPAYSTAYPTQDLASSSVAQGIHSLAPNPFSFAQSPYPLAQGPSSFTPYSSSLVPGSLVYPQPHLMVQQGSHGPLPLPEGNHYQLHGPPNYPVPQGLSYPADMNSHFKPFFRKSKESTNAAALSESGPSRFSKMKTSAKSKCRSSISQDGLPRKSKKGIITKVLSTITNEKKSVSPASLESGVSTSLISHPKADHCLTQKVKSSNSFLESPTANLTSTPQETHKYVEQNEIFTSHGQNMPTRFTSNSQEQVENLGKENLFAPLSESRLAHPIPESQDLFQNSRIYSHGSPAIAQPLQIRLVSSRSQNNELSNTSSERRDGLASPDLPSTPHEQITHINPSAGSTGNSHVSSFSSSPNVVSEGIFSTPSMSNSRANYGEMFTSPSPPNHRFTPGTASISPTQQAIKFRLPRAPKTNSWEISPRGLSKEGYKYGQEIMNGSLRNASDSSPSSGSGASIATFSAASRRLRRSFPRGSQLQDLRLPKMLEVHEALDNIDRIPEWGRIRPPNTEQRYAHYKKLWLRESGANNSLVSNEHEGPSSPNPSNVTSYTGGSQGTLRRFPSFLVVEEYPNSDEKEDEISEIQEFRTEDNPF